MVLEIPELGVPETDLRIFSKTNFLSWQIRIVNWKKLTNAFRQ
jgi:hypothetical protein